MTFKRHARWHWIILGTEYNAIVATQAYVMDDFGTLVPIKYITTRPSLIDGEA